MIQKRKKVEKFAFGIIIQHEDPSKIGRIIRIPKKQMEELDKINSKKRNIFLNPDNEEIIKHYRRYEKRNKRKE
jgi:hypothetical protein